MSRWTLLFDSDRAPYELDLLEVVIGGSDRCQLRLTDTEVAPEHARLRVHNGVSVWLEDLGSSKSTYANGQVLVRPTRLEDGHFFQVGSTKMTLREMRPPSVSPTRDTLIDAKPPDRCDD